MEIKAKLRYLRMSPKKVRWVVAFVRGKKVNEAIVQLNYLDKAAKKPILKLLDSAVANAENNFNLKKDNLFIKEIRVDMAGSLKRWTPKAHGRATPILKRLSHIILVLGEVVPTKQKKQEKITKKKEDIVKVSSLEEIKKSPKDTSVLDKQVEPKQDKHEHEKEIDKEIIDVRLEGKHRHKQNEDGRKAKKSKAFIKKFFNRKAG